MRFHLLLLFLIAAIPAQAHVNSPDVYFEGDAGPYHLFVTVRVPDVIPGVADIEIRSASPDVNEIRITALRIVGPGSELAPQPDIAKRSKEDPQFFTGNLWLMLRGSWQVRIDADGTHGKAQLAVPIPAVAKRPLAMQRTLGIILSVLMVALSIGVVAIVGAAVREAKTDRDSVPQPHQIKRGRIAMGISAILVAAILYLGNQWWSAEAAFSSRFAYKTPVLNAQIEPNNRLKVKLLSASAIDWSEPVLLTDLIPDHGYLMHLFLVRIPELDQFLHLHPEKKDVGLFEQQLPSVQAGKYQVFADVVHRTGFAETYVGEITIPEIAGSDFTGDDCGTSATLFQNASFDKTTANLSDGGTITWQRGQPPLIAKQPVDLRFLVKDKDGNPAKDLELYMGMQGHAQILKSDRSIFAHIHPSGTVSMAALMLTQKNDAMNHSMHPASRSSLPSEFGFRYGFPEPGNYRLFVQVKRSGRIETVAFDTQVTPAPK